jgi:uncharacterized membrane protein
VFAVKMLKGVIGLVLVVVGLVWIGQGVGLLPGSFMTGQAIWAVIGLVVLVVALGLLWSALRPDRSAERERM